MRDDGAIDAVARVLVAGVLPADGVAHAVAEMHARVAEPNACEGSGEQHLGLSFVVVWVLGGAREVLDCAAERLQREDIGDGVCTLVGGAVDGVGGAGGAHVVGDGGPAFEGVAEDVEPGGGVHGGGHGAGVEGVADAEGGFQGAVGNACFCFFGDEVEDGGAGRFGAGAGGGGDGDEGGQGFVDGEAFAEGGVDEVEEAGGGEVGIEVHEFGGVNYLEKCQRTEAVEHRVKRWSIRYHHRLLGKRRVRKLSKTRSLP